jgi:hypothetical protein
VSPHGVSIMWKVSLMWVVMCKLSMYDNFSLSLQCKLKYQSFYILECWRHCNYCRYSCQLPSPTHAMAFRSSYATVFDVLCCQFHCRVLCSSVLCHLQRNPNCEGRGQQYIQILQPVCQISGHDISEDGFMSTLKSSHYGRH